jgi:hypothetical protein
VLVASLGIAQIISWGTLFYAIGVLGPAMRAELGASEVFLFGAFTAGLLVSGAFSPHAGRAVDRRGGRVVLSTGSILGAIAMAILAASHHPWVMAMGWLVAGAAMAACLYDPAFATLSQHTGDRYRRAVTALTLFGGFASTVFWPISQWLLDLVGWRQAFAIYAGLHLFVCLPIHAWIVPRGSGDTAATSASASDSQASVDTRVRWFSASLALASFVVGTLAVHMISLLTVAGLTPQQAGHGRDALRAHAGGRADRRDQPRAPRERDRRRLRFVCAHLDRARRADDGAGNGDCRVCVRDRVRGRQRHPDDRPWHGDGRALRPAGTRHGPGPCGARLALRPAIAPAAFTSLLAFGLTRNEAIAGLVGVSIAAIGCFAAAVRSARLSR